jgi:NADPH:quinone reductase-like Zn-dependent oxidoreductase
VRLPLIPCSDSAGEVVEVGPGVTRVKVGERVAGIFFQHWLVEDITGVYFASALGGTLDGMLADLVVLHEDGLVHFPAHVTYEEAATLPCAAVTAWRGQVTKGGMKAGDTILAQGTGGVSVFALQFGVMAGARVIITSSRDEKLARARQLGAWETVNYKTTPAWGNAVPAAPAWRRSALRNRACTRLPKHFPGCAPISPSQCKSKRWPSWCT